MYMDSFPPPTRTLIDDVLGNDATTEARVSVVSFPLASSGAIAATTDDGDN